MSRQRGKCATDLAIVAPGSAGVRNVRFSRRYMWFGIVAGLLAPVGLLLQGALGDRAIEPIRMFLMLALGGTITFALFGRIIGRRDEGLVARNRELMVLSAALKRLSSIDGLTGIANRRGFDEGLQIELARSARYGQPCALVMIDLDRFKLLNDEHGHQAGDQVLQHVAGLLIAEKRSGDMVARYGGEEFAAILPHVDAAAALTWADRVRTRLAADSIRWNDVDLPITASFGVAALHSHVRGPSDLIEAADRALYVAKGRGGNLAVVEDVSGGAPTGPPATTSFRELGPGRRPLARSPSD